MVRRAVAAYHEMKKKEHKGAFGGTTASEILRRGAARDPISPIQPSHRPSISLA